MKNVIKKISAIAMAFTLLGAGTAITKTVAPQTDNSITASAAHDCNAHVRYTNTLKYLGQVMYYNGRRYKLYEVNERAYCVTCGKCVSNWYWTEWRQG